MAKKKSSSSKITITKATTVKTPTINSYTPSKAVNAAKDGEGKAGSLYQ